MNKHQPYDITYIFHVQSVEDFHGQLRNRADSIVESYDLNTGTDLAQTMLEEIGVRCA